MRRVGPGALVFCRGVGVRLLNLGVALWLVLSGGQPILAQSGSAAVRAGPSLLDIGVGQVETVDIILENAQDVYGIDIRATFDPAVVQVVDADETRDGIQMIPGTFVQPDFMVRNVADNDAGTLQYVITQVNPTPPVNGTGVVFSVQFRGKALGKQSELEVGFVEMADRRGAQLSVRSQSGTLTVVAPKPETPTPEVVASVVPPATATLPVAASTVTSPAVSPPPTQASAATRQAAATQPNWVMVGATMVAVAGCMGTCVVLAVALLVYLRRRPASRGNRGRD